jgi:lipopolysaccharide/colanic/teichoic acid biosynthesis glycosyltransferase
MRTMNPQRNQPIPLIGRGGVQLVAGDASIGLLALPLAALVREILGAVGSPLGVPAGGPQEFDRFALWSVALLSIVLWPLALRAVDPGYPSSYVPIRRIGIAVALWLLAGSGAIYLVDKELASRALVLFAAGIAGGLSLTLRVLRVRSEVRQSAPRVELPMLSGDAERSLARGEPVAISIARLERALPRPTIIMEGGTIWIYPSALSPSERLLKRILDVSFAALLLLALSPVILLVAILVLVRDGRPIFYSDRRAGLFGRPISIRKFRTMRVGADRERAEMWAQSETSGPAFKIAADPRVTSLGRVLRRYSLDELPQLWDVLRGRLSLVGPRPAGLDELERYEDRHRLRLTVRPGVTGLWQVRRRMDDDFEQRISDDLEYIRRWSIVFDLEVILRTIRVVLSGRGV